MFPESIILRHGKGILLLLTLFLLASCARKFMVIDDPAEMPPPRVIPDQPRVALVLGGGAFHGAAHVGVIKVLEDNNIPIDLIIGTSAGSLVGALYADNPVVDSLIPLVNEIRTKDVFDFSLFRSTLGFVSGKRLQRYLNAHLRHSNIEEFPIPFVAVVTDLNHGRSVPLSSGPVAPSVNASCAIPFVFDPVKMYETVYVDGGVLDNIAVDLAISYHPMVIIAVDVMADFDTVPVYKNKTQILQRCYGVASHVLKEEDLKKADVIISPDLTGMPMMSSKDNTRMMDAGISAAEKALPGIRDILIRRSIIR